MGSAIGSKNNVKIYILYLMENINYPIDYVTINDIVMQEDYVMYLDFAECFIELCDSDLVVKIGEENGTALYEVTEKGRLVARELHSDVLASILDRALASALRYLNFKKRNIVSHNCIKKRPDGRYDFSCWLIENKEEIFRTVITLDTEERAIRMRDNFLSRGDQIYRGVLAMFAGNVNYLFDK